jgi:hypothetical protein
MAQQVDTLAFQDFEINPTTAHPVWNFTGPVVYNSGNSAANAAPPNSPLGINGSRAWETTTNSAGLVLDFANTPIPAVYDSVRVRFRLAAFNLVSTAGGPDDADFVLVAISTDGGTTIYNRMRIRGATTNNSFWAYSATGYAKVPYLPATEAVFQPTSTGLQTTFGYSTCEIVFPGSVSQVMLRVTGRSSASSDTWMIDNVLLTGERCFATATTNASICSGSTYTLPSGAIVSAAGIYNDTVAVAGGCDSIYSVNLSVQPSSVASVNASICDGDSYQRPGGSVVTTAGVYTDIVVAANGCDSTITTILTVSPAYNITNPVNICTGQSYTLPGGNVVSTSGSYLDNLQSTAGCDSVITTILNVVAPIDTTVIFNGNGLTANQAATSYQWIDCSTGQNIPNATGQNYTPFINGNYAVVINVNGCTATSACWAVLVGVADPQLVTLSASPNPVRDAFVLSGWNTVETPLIRVYDVAGRQVQVNASGQGSSLRIGMQGLPAGIYTVEAVGQGHVRVVKHD